MVVAVVSHLCASLWICLYVVHDTFLGMTEQMGYTCHTNGSMA